MEGGPERTNVSFRPSASVTNEWTFKMTPGDLTVDIEFTHEFPDPANASLSAIYPSAGSLIPDFTKDNFNYTIAVPFGTAAFSVSAQAENPYLAPEMLSGGGDNLLDADLMASKNGGPLPEGSSGFGITLTSEDESVENTYNIDVILLPDLSLKTFQVTKADKDFARDLASLDEQNVYLPYYEGLAIVAETNDGGASVRVSPSAAVPGLNPVAPAVITVTVSKNLPGVEAKYTAKDYALNLYYGEGMATDPLASGGYVSFVPGEDGAYYEVHRFVYNAGQPEQSLVFTDGVPEGLTAWVLVVGGGGSGSAGHTPGNGGGSGGVAEHTNYPLTADSYQVVVGAGGVAVTSSQFYAFFGNNGADSRFGVGAFIGYGGGGGGGSYYGAGHGKDGGSSGGGGDNVPATAKLGVAPEGGSVYGNAGAASNRTGNPDANSQGGGGAGGPGSGANGGPGITRNITGTPVSYAAGGGSNVPAANGEPGTGNGGRQAGHGPPATSYAGGSGVVIVRFPRTVTVAAQETPAADAE